MGISSEIGKILAMRDRSPTDTASRLDSHGPPQEETRVVSLGDGPSPQGATPAAGMTGIRHQYS